MEQFLTPRQYYQLHGIRPRKRFGQHFLAQPAMARRIVASAAIEETDVVVEIGPGLGALTQFIPSEVGGLHLVELDRDLAEYLQAVTKTFPGNVYVHQMDVLSFNFRAVSDRAGTRLIVLGNLPYNITSPLIFHLLDSLGAVKRCVFMVQKEVGERLTAVPGNKAYGVLSVLLGIYASSSKLFLVSPQQFYPQPRVDSLVIKIEFVEESQTNPLSFKRLRSMVSLAFQQRRKTLRNSLKSLDSAKIERAFGMTGIDPQRRPETLTPEEFVRLTLAYESIGGLCSKQG